MTRKRERPRKRRRPLGVRLLRAALKTLVGLALFYVIGINVFLSTPLFAKVLGGDPETIDIHYQSAWSVLPGRVHGKGISIRGRDSHVEWMLRIDEADFDMSFAALTKQRFDVSRVHGTGISFRVRRRLDAAPATPAEVSDLPPIDGFGTYSVRPPPGPSLDLWSDADYHLWTAHLENVTADDVREVWIDHVRFEGNGRVVGRFYLKPLRAVEVGPARVDVHHGDVHQGATVLVDGLAGSRADLALAQLDPRTIDGAGILHHISGTLDVHGACPEIAALAVSPAGTKLEGPVEVQRLALAVKSGVVTGDGHLGVHAPHVVVVAGEHRVESALALDADVTRAKAGAREELHFQAAMSSLSVARTKATHEPDGVFLRAVRAVASGDSRELDLARPFGDLHFVVALNDGTLDHARDLSAYIPKTTPVAILGGNAQAEGSLEVWLAEKRATGRGSLRAADLDFRLAKMRARGSTWAEVSFAAWRWESRRLEDVKLALDISRGSLAADDSPKAPIARVTGLRVDAHGVEADVDDPLRNLEVAINLPEGRIEDRSLLQAYLPKGSAMQIALGRFAATCHVVIADHIARGTLEVQSKRLRLTYADLALAADVRARARVHAWHWERGDLALDDATVDVRSITIARSSDAAAAPVSIGRILVRAKSTRFDFADPLARVTLDASVADGKVSDAALVSAFLPPESTFAFQADDAELSGEMHVDVAKHVARGTVAARSAKMGITGRAFRLSGDADVTAEVADWDLANDTMNVLDSRAVVTRARGSLHPRGAWDFGADRIELDARTEKLALARPSLLGVDGHLVVTNAVLPDARALQTLLPRDGVVTIESGRAVVSADLDLSPSTATGVVDVSLPHTGVRFHEVHVVGDFHALARVQGFDARRNIVDLSGSTLAMRNVAVTNAPTDASRWRGDAVMNRATLNLSPPQLDAWLTLDADDASPVLAVLLRKGLPGILAGMTSMKHLVASARLTARAHQLALCSIDARGGDLSFRGCYVVRDEHRRAAFVVRKEFLTVGLWLADKGGVHVRFFGLEGWLRGETDRAVRLWRAE